MGRDFYSSDLGVGSGMGIQLSVDGACEYKVGGITIDWSTVSAVSGADVTLLDGTKIPIGSKYLRYGQCMAMIGTAPVYTFTHTGGPTAGVATITIPEYGGRAAETFTLAYNATAAEALAAARAVSRFGVAGVTTFTRSGAGSNGDPYIYTLTLDRSIYIPLPTATHTFTGGTTPTETIAASTAAALANGKWGPYDPAASDGRQTAPAAGVPLCVLDVTHLEGNANVTTTRATNFGSAITGGNVWRDRLIAGLGSASLANGPTYATLQLALPRLVLV